MQVPQTPAKTTIKMKHLLLKSHPKARKLPALSKNWYVVLPDCLFWTPHPGER